MGCETRESPLTPQEHRVMACQNWISVTGYCSVVMVCGHDLPHLGRRREEGDLIGKELRVGRYPNLFAINPTCTSNREGNDRGELGCRNRDSQAERGTDEKGGIVATTKEMIDRSWVEHVLGCRG